MTVVINIMGAPCSGKSVFSAKIFIELKVRGYCIEYVQEYAKVICWRKEFDRLKDQKDISLNQYNMLNNINNYVDYIVTDGPLLTQLYYNMTHSDVINDRKENEIFIRDKLTEFNNKYIFMDCSYSKYQTKGRYHSEESTKTISDGIKKLLDDNNIEYIINTIDTPMEDIINYILS